MTKEDLSTTVELIASHPKVVIVTTTFFTSQVWLDFGMPTVQGVTSIIGLGVLVLLFVQRLLDIKQKHFDKSPEEK